MTFTAFGFWLATVAWISLICAAAVMWLTTGENQMHVITDSFISVCALSLGYEYGKECRA